MGQWAAEGTEGCRGYRGPWRVQKGVEETTNHIKTEGRRGDRGPWRAQKAGKGTGRRKIEGA
jgi:hypothetical protein